MHNMVIYLIFMFFLSVVGLFLGFNFYFYSKSFMLEWLVYTLNSVNIEIYVLVDWVSLLFVGVVMLISSMVMMYSVSYMRGELHISRFYLLVFIFVLSMILMIMSPNLISILLGWDGLGLVSYCLVIYYQNVSSYNSGMVTVLSNRIGDVGLLVAIGLMFMSGSWGMYLLEGQGVMFFIFLAAITKSAQIPFSYWLPQAMAAPTPVSSLVHSSTLVTAGVYLLIRFSEHLNSGGVSHLLLALSVLTSFMSGLMANFEYDLKKIIALSTLSQLGLMMMILGVGLSGLAFYHLITHALFKSLLFLCAGAMIHLMSNNQDIRFYGALNEVTPFVMVSFYISSMALCGTPFLSGFYSKDLIMEMFYSSSVSMIFLVVSVLSLLMTVSYTFRLMCYVFFGGGPSFYYSWFSISSSWTMNFSMVILLLLSVVSGTLMNWVFFFDFYDPFMAAYAKMFTLGACLAGLPLGALAYLINFVKFYSFSYFISSMWMMSFFFSFVYKPSMICWDLASEFDKTWVEYSMKLNFFFVMEKFKLLPLLTYKIHMFMMVVLAGVLLAVLF